jgi:hypothetical protein
VASRRETAMRSNAIAGRAAKAKTMGTVSSLTAVDPPDRVTA